LGFDVDDVMDKILLAKHAETYVGRLLRAMHRFEEARTETSKRMHELIVSSLTRPLSSIELEDLNTLRASLGLWTLGSEIEDTAQIKQRLNQKEAIIEALENLSNKER
jgi:hypothetical protein